MMPAMSRDQGQRNPVRMARATGCGSTCLPTGGYATDKIPRRCSSIPGAPLRGTTGRTMRDEQRTHERHAMKPGYRREDESRCRGVTPRKQRTGGMIPGHRLYTGEYHRSRWCIKCNADTHLYAAHRKLIEWRSADVHAEPGAAAGLPDHHGKCSRGGPRVTPSAANRSTGRLPAKFAERWSLTMRGGF